MLNKISDESNKLAGKRRFEVRKEALLYTEGEPLVKEELTRKHFAQPMAAPDPTTIARSMRKVTIVEKVRTHSLISFAYSSLHYCRHRIVFLIPCNI